MEKGNDLWGNVLLKNIDEDIPINFGLSDTLEKHCIHNENINNLKNQKVYR